MPRLLNMSQIMSKKYVFMENMPEKMINSFGKVSIPFTAIIWGKSGQGKTNLLMEWLEMLTTQGPTLYISLEEGHEASMRETLIRHFENKPELFRQIIIGNHEMTYAATVERLKKKRSPQFVIIDSLQYWAISYEQYKELKALFPKKCFLFISHSQGKDPLGSTAKSVRYDVGIKIWVDRFIAFPTSRYGGNQPFVIWEQGAKDRWGAKEFKKITSKR